MDTAMHITTVGGYIFARVIGNLRHEQLHEMRIFSNLLKDDFKWDIKLLQLGWAVQTTQKSIVINYLTHFATDNLGIRVRPIKQPQALDKHLVYCVPEDTDKKAEIIKQLKYVRKVEVLWPFLTIKLFVEPMKSISAGWFKANIIPMNEIERLLDTRNSLAYKHR